ncbi:hypothetical protein VTO42DRAFT_7580 [Malbranchea cinnamomea]
MPSSCVPTRTSIAPEIYSGPSRPVTSHNTGTTTRRPRTARPTTTATSVATQDIICAISESRGISPTVGLAFVNLSTSEAVLCQICDTQTYARTVQKLVVFDPTEILFTRTAKESCSKLYSIVEENLPHLNITAIDRRYFAEQTGHEYVEQLALKDDLESIKLSLDGIYFAICCFAAALSYIELELGTTFAFHSLRIRYEPSEGSMMIDFSTIVSLELIQNLQNAKSKDCLFGLLNVTQTPMGSRLLRSNLLQPSTEPAKLNARYDAVEELSTKEAMFYSVRQALKSFVDSDRVLTALTLIPTKATFELAEQSINNVIMLKTYVSAIKPVYEALAGAKSSLLLAIRDLCMPANYEPIQDLISLTLNEDVRYQSKPLDLRNQRIYAVKSGVNSLLDVARQTYQEANNDVVELASRLGDTYDLPLDLRFEPARQYYFRLSVADLDSRPLPDVFINVFRKKSFLEFQTLDLVKLNQKITDSHNEVVNMSDRSVQELIDDVRSEISPLFRISEGIAMLDMLTSFAHLVTMHDYVRPELTDTLAIKAGRHPIREKIHSAKFIPNDAYATQQSRFQIITGCNMSGKSSFVPAQYASFPVVRQLFARVSADDYSQTNASTFSAEMREMAFILRNIDPRSMVIIDELGRGTSTVDGLAIAVAIAEALVDSHALVWFVTHFHDLARILSQRNGVVNLHLAVELDPATASTAPRMAMLYKIADGYVEDRHYGLAIAKLLPFPPRMLEVAEQVSQTLSSKIHDQIRHTKTIAVTRRRQLLLSLKEKLLQAKEGRLRGEKLRAWLKQLQDEFTLEMAAIDGDVARVVRENNPDGEDEVNMEPVEGRASEQAERGVSSELPPMPVDDIDDLTNVTSPSAPA